MQLSECKATAAWLSRHPPGPEHRRNLADYRLVVLPDRWESAQQAWDKVLSTCGKAPALIVAIMPDDMLVELVKLADPSPVIRPKQAFGDVNHWTGKWEQIRYITKPTYAPWTPEVSHDPAR